MYYVLKKNPLEWPLLIAFIKYEVCIANDSYKMGYKAYSGQYKHLKKLIIAF
jgi:hypothetical protein